VDDREDVDVNLSGVLIAVICFALIGIFHPIVIKAEYFFSAKCWPFFLIAGLIFLGLSVCMQSVIAATALGVLGCSCLWSIVELWEQKKRVEKGWFPTNPHRKKKLK